MSLAGVKQLFCREAHIEPTRSEAAEDYVWKQETKIAGTEFEIGVKSFKVNSKVDWSRQLSLAKHGKFEEMDPGVLLRNYNTVKKIRFDFADKPADLDNVCGIWFYGPPGSGKSYTARISYPGIFDKPCNKWFDGYDPNTNAPILLDDFDKNHSVLGHHLKRWADRYAFTAEIKGGSIMIRPFKVVITSNYEPNQIFYNDDSLLQAITRRFEIIKFE